MFHKLDEVELHFSDVETRLTSPEVVGNAQLFQKLSKEHAGLQPLVDAYRQFKQVKRNFEENKHIIEQESGELKELALAENKDLEKELEELERKLKVLLLPKDPNDDKNIMLEIRPAAGGDEAGIFVGDLFRMYSKYAEKRGWQVELMEATPNDVGGFKEIILMIRGDKVYSVLKYESGVHRVQRVPKTETQGRIHTSTVTVAVLPEAEDVEIDINPNDLRIDVFRSSGPGGQSVNTTDSAVRITHHPSGLVVVCRDEKSQHKNKAKALKVLKTRLLDIAQREQHSKIAADRLSQVGTGDRSEKIRTYNFPQGRVTDHRIGVTLHKVNEFVGGDIEEMISALIAFYEAEALKRHSESA
ncbi:MAG: peptide chain release factor 1 [Proteobacteria bacterium]|nr:peptide chain release factor 1 [Pseudomonadota bacterium]NDC25171.1 peptide chain release factor 1 [Pseudomonadota bacterium]NDD04640.1 peptide chain release factor 1 [Pseudomonadota bacterium]